MTKLRELCMGARSTEERSGVVPVYEGLIIPNCCRSHILVFLGFFSSTYFSCLPYYHSHSQVGTPIVGMVLSG